MNFKPLMICIHCGGLPFNGETIPSGQSLGGSESAAYFMAKELANLGHKVVVFTNMPKPGNWDGVIYDHAGQISEQAPLGDRFHFAMKVPWDVVIIQRHPLAFALPVNAKCNIWWLHDLALHRYAPLVDKQVAFIDQIFTVSEFHRKQVSEVYGIDKEFITATTNGVDYSLFEKLRKSPPARDRKLLVFASRPERGLEELVGEGGIMELLPEFDLAVCGYDHTTREMAPLYQYLWARCAALPNVKNYGPLGKAQLYDLLARCGAYVYTTNFEDTSNIMLLEANAVGTPFIGPADHAALPETGRGGSFIGVPLKDGKGDRAAFANAIKSLLNNDSAWQRQHERALSKRQSWEDAALQWTEEIYRILEEKSSNVFRLTKHLEHMSDIESIMQLHGRDVAEIEKILPDFSTNYGFYLSDEPDAFKKHYDAYYQYEEDRGQVYGPEDMFGNARFEHTSNVIGEIAPRTLLDVGCAHGHFIMNLLRKFPEMQITGIDINQKNIDAARAWADKDNPPVQPELICGTIGDLDAERKFDCILAGEVLEHVKDPKQFLEDLKKHLNENGSLVLTTPYGPWEAVGYKRHPGWRSHVHHLERWDWHELAANQPGFKLIAIPFDFKWGHYLVHFKAGGLECGSIDYERKLSTQSPRETVSLCMIARDAEKTLAQTLDKVKDIADEIIVVIDADTRDATFGIANKFGAQITHGASPMDVGFAAARNESIKNASCDWVLWLDADEHFERAENVARYLRRSPVMGFGVPQHHFSEEPPGILKTDFPCRLFRNNRGVKFFGLVHEHPEVAMNDGVGKVSILSDFGLMHFGYATEAIRRERFKRNWPLMVRDFKENPNRLLGQFLWMRDLAHACKYHLEKNGGQMSQEIAAFAEEAIKMWDCVLDGRNVRMIADGLQYYSEAVSYLRNGNGIEYQIDLKCKLGNMAPTIPTMRGYFLNAEHIRKFAGIVNNEAVKLYEEKYF